MTQSQNPTKTIHPVAEKVVTWSRLSAVAVGPLFAITAWLALQMYGDIASSLKSIETSLATNSLNILELQVQMIERTTDRFTGADGEAIRNDIQRLDERITNIENDIQELRTRNEQ